MKYFLWLFLISLVVFRYFSARPVYKDGDRVRITTRITSEPTRYDYNQRLGVAGLKVSLPLFPEVSYGDKIILEGIVQKKELKDAKLTIVGKDNYFPKLRLRLISFYKSVLPEPHSSLVAGIILGSKSSFPRDFWEKLKNTGTLHVVVASGMNVTLASSFLIGFLSIFFKRKVAIPLVILGIFFYIVLSGFDAPIIRAGIMGGVAFVGQELGRVVNAFRVLVLTAILMLIIWPDWVGDLGFILSFVATASILLFEPRIKAWLGRKLKILPKFLKEDFATTLGAQIGVTPILIVSFGQFNPLSSIINVLIIWAVPFIMIIGAVGGAAGLLIPPLGEIILYLTYPLTGWFVKIVELFG